MLSYSKLRWVEGQPWTTVPWHSAVSDYSYKHCVLKIRIIIFLLLSCEHKRRDRQFIRTTFSLPCGICFHCGHTVMDLSPGLHTQVGSIPWCHLGLLHEIGNMGKDTLLFLVNFLKRAEQAPTEGGLRSREGRLGWFSCVKEWCLGAGFLSLCAMRHGDVNAIISYFLSWTPQRTENKCY